MSVNILSRIAFFALLSGLLGACGDSSKESRISPKLSNITESVYASITVRPEDSYYPQATRSGIIEEIFVEEGDQVKKGQLLFQISPTAEVSNRLSTAQLNLQEARANFLGEDNLLLNLEAELRSVKEQLQLDSTNLKRKERLWAEKAIKKVDLEQAQLAYTATRNNYRILQNRHAQQLNSLKNTYQKAVNQVETERSQLGDYGVRSKMDGKVYIIQKEVGELISPQEAFAEIGSGDRFAIEMDIDEVDITKISLGDSVIISLEAYPNEVFLAKTSKIAPKKDEKTQTFRVESHFVQEPPKLYNGLSGEANIVVARRKNALTIPASYLLPGNRVLTPDGEIEVKTGVKNMDFVEILSGITSSTVLEKPEQP